MGNAIKWGGNFVGLIGRRSYALAYETWPNMYSAAEERFYDALTLACSDANRAAGAIYLMGYVSEALLKTAYCQFNQLPNGDNMYVFLRSQIRPNDLHSLTRLLYQLITARIATNNPMNAAVAGAALTYVSTSEQHWEVKMRYFDFPATVEEANEVLSSIDGLFAIYDDLWN